MYGGITEGELEIKGGLGAACFLAATSRADPNEGNKKKRHKNSDGQATPALGRVLLVLGRMRLVAVAIVGSGTYIVMALYSYGPI